MDDANTNCSSNSALLAANCTACVAPSATFTTDKNCETQQYYVAITVTNMGSNTALTVQNLNIINTGTYTVGPFAISDTIVLTLQGNTTSSCVLISDSLTTECLADTIGINDNHTQLIVFPNPATEVITINAKTDGQVQFLDITGKILNTYTVYQGQNHINVSQLPSGVYLARMHTTQGLHYARIVIRH